tara:strand:+ start:64 stop:699 length:636 start_codon:yes stop_codon:yes gene_type:complete
MKKELFKYPKEDKGVIDDFYKEIFFDNEYNKHGAKVKDGDIVIDCGAHVGMFSHYALKKGASKIYSFEAVENRYQSLVENTKLTPNIIPTHGFISDRHNPIDKKYSIEGIIEDNKLSHVDFLKMDIEHGEYPVLIEIKPSTLNKVKKWAIEIHLEWLVVDDKNIWTHGRDFHHHKTSKLLYIMNKFSTNRFSMAFERPHKAYEMGQLYAWK